MAARGRRGEARVRGGEPRGWLYAEGRGEQVSEGPRRQCPRHCLSAWSRGNDDEGWDPASERERERERGAGLAAARCAPRGRRRLGRPSWAGLVASRVGFPLFFLKPFLFFFSGF